MLDLQCGEVGSRDNYSLEALVVLVSELLLCMWMVAERGGSCETRRSRSCVIVTNQQKTVVLIPKCADGE